MTKAQEWIGQMKIKTHEEMTRHEATRASQDQFPRNEHIFPPGSFRCAEVRKKRNRFWYKPWTWRKAPYITVTYDFIVGDRIEALYPFWFEAEDA